MMSARLGSGGPAARILTAAAAILCLTWAASGAPEGGGKTAIDFTERGTGVAPTWLTASKVAMNVMAGTITSSPGPTPRAWSASRSASSPLAMPTQ